MEIGLFVYVERWAQLHYWANASTHPLFHIFLFALLVNCHCMVIRASLFALSDSILSFSQAHILESWNWSPFLLWGCNFTLYCGCRPSSEKAKCDANYLVNNFFYCHLGSLPHDDVRKNLLSAWVRVSVTSSPVSATSALELHVITEVPSFSLHVLYLLFHILFSWCFPISCVACYKSSSPWKNQFMISY